MVAGNQFRKDGGDLLADSIRAGFLVDGESTALDNFVRTADNDLQFGPANFNAEKLGGGGWWLGGSHGHSCGRLYAVPIGEGNWQASAFD
jgi:hypothetical protein